ncbi:MAG: TRAP transporter small permease subunit [Pseudomonadota bacterium]
MQSLLKLSAVLDKVLAFFGKLGAWCGLLLVLVVVYDVISRYAGVPKPFGLNSTMIQESEYWLHSFLFMFMIGYAYVRQSHVRIDLVRERFPLKVKYALEALGCLLFIVPYSLVFASYSWRYAYTSFLEGEISKSVIGLSNIWILKMAMPLMFALLFIAAISQLIKSIAGLAGKLPDDMISQTLGGDN